MNRNTNRIAFESIEADHVGKNVSDYWIVCKQQLWLIVAFVVGFAGLAAGWSLMQTPLYKAQATVVVDQEGPGGLEHEKAYYHPDITPEYFQTQFELMKSHYVFQRAAKRLHLSEVPEYRPRRSAMRSMLASLVPTVVIEFVVPKKGASELSPEDVEERLLKRFTNNIEIMPIRGARLAHISAISEDPKFAALAANTLADVYIERTQELNAMSKEQSAHWLTAHVDELRKKAESSQQALYAFRAKHGLLGGRDRQGVVAQTNTELDAELVRAEMRKAESQARMEQIQSVLRNKTDKNGLVEIDWSSLDASTEVLTSPLIQNLRAQEIKASGQVAELSDKYGPLHPKLARARAELDDFRERIRQEVQKIYDSVKREHDASIARVRAIKEAATRHRQEKIKLEQSEIEYGILEREAESNQHLFEIFLKQAKEADLSAGKRSANVYIADPAVPNSLPAKPKKTLNVLLGFLVGLMSGVACALLRDARDRSLRSASDVERYLPTTSLLGIMPVMTAQESSNGQLLLTSQASTPAAESVRIIRTNVLLSRPRDLPGCVLITSPGEGEGKTTLAVSLAAAEAQLEDARVLLINADLRKRSSHFIYGLHDEEERLPGLADFLNGRADIHEIIHATKVPKLSVIAGGGCPWNPAELLHSKNMAKLLTYCREEGFHIILDTPPVLPVADALVLASQVDGVLLVVAANQTTREACRIALQRLSGTGAKILGVVLQKATSREKPYFYGGYGVYGANK